MTKLIQHILQCTVLSCDQKIVWYEPVEDLEGAAKHFGWSQCKNRGWLCHKHSEMIS